ncbi:MAG: sulfurtransferase complex subunit TusC [Gammaproteobacteria bacterium]|jgi:tRNA 2-thiouridine synthesizing protein C|nr:sulfurtransferase complex subunit TusC [Gammaproteobacteria bacterium]
MNPKNILIIIRQAPYSSTLPAAALDILLTAAAFEQNITLLFMGDGVLHLLSEQNATSSGMRNISKALPSLELYEVKKIFLEESALHKRKIENEELVMPLATLSLPEIAEVTEKADQVFNF